MHGSWEDNISEDEQWGEIDIGRKGSSYIEKDCCDGAQMTAELNIQLEDPVSTKTVRSELHKSNIHRKAAIANP
jgi:hypothetical protein